jgi:hypothetical protein
MQNPPDAESKSYRSPIAGAIAGLFFAIGFVGYVLTHATEPPGRPEYLILVLICVILIATGALAGIGIGRILALCFPKK